MVDTRGTFFRVLETIPGRTGLGGRGIDRMSMSVRSVTVLDT